MLNYKIITFVFASVVMISCKKDWIEVKSDKALDVPTSIEDFQALLDNVTIMNDNRPSLGEISADNYYLTDTLWESWSSINRNAYVWAGDIYSGLISDQYNWNNSYAQVFYANIALEGIDKVGQQDYNTSAWNNVKGSALFYRGEAFFNLSQLFAKPYSLTFPDNPGIPLRLNADPNEVSVRSSLQQTYDQILSDLQSSVDHLPDVPLYKTRPSKPAAYALLSRVYLVKQDFGNALKYADLCLKLYDSLLDYNTLNANAQFPIPQVNREVIFMTSIETSVLLPNTHIVDSTLYQSYDLNDLRKKILYRANTAGQLYFNGTYTGGARIGVSRTFGGIATDEVYLTRAECYARTGNVSAAMSDLNALMSKRIKTGFFVPFTAGNASEALNLILAERRKETPFRGLRWIDLRRLNSEGANIILTRKLKGQSYTLPPNDPKYALPIPPDVISLTGMPQNVR
ncbi:RagB/SusD family nutrient uptake outer membrane protein [Longitalea arenae]|uniref:RagB/SusD family nutrient uptake outer membrane protein n=1 Tax=Longitalea arenae TaxID=2812558 RepID=UPI0019675FC4|nr:RagB/SusD family nutrient uptake outer membrane protein [Longitalea arenae]